MTYQIVRNSDLNTWEVWSVYGIPAGKGFTSKEDAQRHIDTGAADHYLVTAYPRKDPLLQGYAATPEDLKRIASGS